MDNASNCDHLAVDLPKYLPLFRGLAAHARCFPHIVNLIAKVRFLDIYLLNLLTVEKDFSVILFQTTKD